MCLDRMVQRMEQVLSIEIEQIRDGWNERFLTDNHEQPPEAMERALDGALVRQNSEEAFRAHPMPVDGR